MLLWFVIVYWVISIGIGLWAAMRVKNTADFAAAGHSLPMYIVTATVFATWFGSETVLGVPATFLKEGYRPVGVRTYRGIAFIASAKFNSDGTLEGAEIGTFPSPDWNTL